MIDISALISLDVRPLAEVDLSLIGPEDTCISLPGKYPYRGLIVTKSPGAVLWTVTQKVRLGANGHGLFLGASFGTWGIIQIGWVSIKTCSSEDAHLMKWCVCYEGLDKAPPSQVE